MRVCFYFLFRSKDTTTASGGGCEGLQNQGFHYQAEADAVDPRHPGQRGLKCNGMNY